MGMLQVHNREGFAMSINLDKILFFNDLGDDVPTIIYIEAGGTVMPIKVQEDYATIMEAMVGDDFEGYEGE